MAILSADKTYVTVTDGDTLWDIAQTYLGDPYKYKQLAAIRRNNIADPHWIYSGQIVYLYDDPPASSTPAAVAKPSPPAVPTVTQFGVSSTSKNTLFAAWSWGKEDTTESYKIAWAYTTADGVEFVDLTSNTVDQHYYAAARTSTYTIPEGAVKVTFRVKPISKTYKNNDKDTTYWTADWSTLKTHNVVQTLDGLSAPSIEIKDFKITAELENLNTEATGVQFRLVKNNTTVVNTTATVTINKTTKYASYAWPSVDAGSEYKVCCRAVKGNLYSDWSDYSSSVSTAPAAPASITTCKAIDETTVYLAWSEASSATGYEIEHTTTKDYFDKSDEVTSVTVEEGTGYYVTNLETGKEHFFRVRAKNTAGDSKWTPIVSVKIGKAPSAPTTWSSTTTAIVGEIVNLYWVHNSEDGSSQTSAALELTIDDADPYIIDVSNNRPDDEKDKTSVYSIDTAGYTEGISIKWRVQTAGVTLTYGDWSTQRTIDIYAKPTLRLDIVNGAGEHLEEIASFPFYVTAVPGPDTQHPIGYHLTVKSNEMYESADAIGNPVVINAGQEVYSKFFDTNFALMAEMSAGNIDLERNIRYTLSCIVTMDSGLTAENSLVFTVTWSEVMYTPNASISIDPDSYTAYIRPYCENQAIVSYLVNDESGVYTKTDTALYSAWGKSTLYYLVTNEAGAYVKTDTVLHSVWGESDIDGTLTTTGERVLFGVNEEGDVICFCEVESGALTTTGERVLFGVDGEGNEICFCEVEESTAVENVLLSVYRREFDGTFTEIATDLDNARNVTVTDPHPALDYARYRIVSTSTETGAVGYYDMPGYPVGGVAVMIQWNEEWSRFEVDNEDAMSQPPWSGSLLKLPYNIDVSDSNSSDVSLVEYIGRAHPVTYYGTHRGNVSTWNVEIPKSDKETLYALRRLAIWMGDVYVREPSGTGYWAHVKVSYNQKHCDLTIPVTFDITRVEGGV